ncbi:hypothetical protein [Campylobacter hyointestinalis]|uniref:hypothetical protein n=1 Tax=Campylobacter hyointestinalis TaxID=198 RepID=UPI00126641E5|nr:hypothetical protein [Campylobacter hyointestinalis]
MPKYGIKGLSFSTMKFALIVSPLFSGSLVTPWLIVFGLTTLPPKEFKISQIRAFGKRKEILKIT